MDEAFGCGIALRSIAKALLTSSSCVMPPRAECTFSSVSSQLLVKVVGVLLINVYGSAVDVSRRLIEEGRSVEDFRQLAKLYPLYKLDEPEEEKKAEKSE